MPTPSRKKDVSYSERIEMIQQNVICMKWGTLYSADYVNVLFAACRRHTKTTFRFVCFTDDPLGVNPEIETFPIPEIGCSARIWGPGGGGRNFQFFPQLSIT